MDALHWLWRDETTRFLATFSPSSPYGAPAVCGALFLTLGWWAWHRRARGRTLRLRAFLRAFFPRRILLHASSIVDLKLWTLNTLVFASGYALLAFGALFWRDRSVDALSAVFGPSAGLAAPPILKALVATFGELLAYEFGYWASHYAFHRIPALWAFHKVHHSAEVMTTLTEMRQHPVEIIAFMNVIGLTTGLTFGAMTYAFGPGVGRLTLLNGNLVLVFFMLTWGHLRHSHIWMPFRGLAGRLFQSPAHHQVHHSTDPRHFDKNLGFALAVFDWAFGTLHVPAREREVVEYGVGEEREEFSTVGRALVRPFARASEALTPRAAPGAVVPERGEQAA